MFIKKTNAKKTDKKSAKMSPQVCDDIRLAQPEILSGGIKRNRVKQEVLTYLLIQVVLGLYNCTILTTESSAKAKWRNNALSCNVEMHTVCLFIFGWTVTSSANCSRPLHPMAASRAWPFVNNKQSGAVVSF